MPTFQLFGETGGVWQAPPLPAGDSITDFPGARGPFVGLGEALEEFRDKIGGFLAEKVGSKALGLGFVPSLIFKSLIGTEQAGAGEEAALAAQRDERDARARQQLEDALFWARIFQELLTGSWHSPLNQPVGRADP